MPIMSRFRFSAKLLFLIMTLVMSYYALEVLKGTDTGCPRFFRILKEMCLFQNESYKIISSEFYSIAGRSDSISKE